MNLPSYSRMIHQVDVLLGQPTPLDLAGGLENGFTLLLAAVNCMITDEGGDRFMDVGQLGREIERKRATILFLDLIDLKQGHYLRYTTPAGKIRIFLVDSFRDDQDQGRMWVAKTTEQPDPNTE
jgi:hypothetical protein